MDELSPEAWQMFWEALEAMTPEQQNGVLEFATGSFHLPEGGLAVLQFSLAPTRSMEPTAVPCFSTLQETSTSFRICITVNMLTPGVPIMDHLTSSLREHLKQLQADGQLPKDLRIAVSGPEEAGEGEHKISRQMLRNESAAQAPGGDECHIIVGTDSDLLLVPVALHRGPKRVAVTRREDGLTQRKSALRVFSGDRLVQAMGRQLHSFATQPQPAAPTPKDLQQLRLDFLLVMLFRGNDYLPALVSGHDPADLWTQYLRWRQSSIGAAGIVQIENVGEEQEGVVLTPAHLSAFLQSQGSGWLPARLSGVVPKDGVALYLEALLWCLETYCTGRCPDCQRRFPAYLKELFCREPTQSSQLAFLMHSGSFASASVMVEEIPTLPPECFKARHRDAPPLSALCCALAVLPVADARRVVLPAQPGLAPLLQEGGLLGEARLPRMNNRKNERLSPSQTELSEADRLNLRSCLAATAGPYPPLRRRFPLKLAIQVAVQLWEVESPLLSEQGSPVTRLANAARESTQDLVVKTAALGASVVHWGQSMLGSAAKALDSHCRPRSLQDPKKEKDSALLDSLRNRGGIVVEQSR
eukprot:s1170_g12.t1